jgi:hypothetical protein
MLSEAKSLPLVRGAEHLVEQNKLLALSNPHCKHLHYVALQIQNHMQQWM